MKLINIVIFAAAFILVTGGLMFFNSIYANIFQFDFTPVSQTDSVSVANTISKNDPAVELNKQMNKKVEPLQKDTTKSVVQADTVLKVPNLTAKPQVIPVKNETAQINNTTEAPKADIIIENRLKNKADIDTIYNQWVKQTAKLYESMDPKKAAKIIRTYSETTARDIIYKMKKKQAAEILSELDPVTANRLTEYHDFNQKELIKN